MRYDRTRSRRLLLAIVPAAAVTSTAAPAANEKRVCYLPTDNPVFAAIARDRGAVHGLSAAHEPSDALLAQLSRAETDAFLAWLTTPPTTRAGVIAILEHASRRAREEGNGSHVYTSLAESALYDPGGDPDDILTTGEQSPAMVAAALRPLDGLR
jgi:hypothetical protein